MAHVAGIVHAANVDRIEPTDWYVGMKNPSLQLMIYGKDVRDAQVTVDYPGVTIDSLVRLDSPNYLLVYLNVADAKAGEIVLKIDRQRVKYQLKQREKRGEERIGFSNADVLYQLMPDRFASGTVENDQLITMNRYQCDRSNPNLRHGGDLEGIRQHLDYFNELGVTALWFTPVLENNSPDRDGSSTYHGYAPTNYYRIDPRFGTNEDYRRLTDEAHQHGLKMVMDMIFNHCGFEHPWVADMPSHDWFNLSEELRMKSEEFATAHPTAHLDSSFFTLHSSLKRYFRRDWFDYASVKDNSASAAAIREALTAAVKRQLMSDVPYGVLLSGGLDSSVISAIAEKYSEMRIEDDSRTKAYWPRLHSFAVGLKGAPDLETARMVAEHIGTVHHEITYTIQEGLDAIRDVIYFIETYDVTTVRASTPMYLLARVIKSMGI
ncbi:MAG: cyclomaltodextrinase N-terminal domain-containing protein, partial [Paludibacteraceae bacterium]|nr:cyclomaltodextrinase N-terminal domain-containing protein [Paludibacteraceae bacterium]